MPGIVRKLAFAALAILAWGCEREKRNLRMDPPASAALENVALMPGGIGGTPPDIYPALGKPYVTNAYSLSQGKRLYAWFGCQACHGDGRGRTAPSFIDGWWRYGPDMASLVVSIRDGRPHGMPAFRDRLTIEQIWQLAGYIQVMGSYSPSYGAPGRNDELQTRPAENRAPAAIDEIEPKVGR